MCNHDTLTEQDFHLISTPSASNQTLPWAEDADLATVTQRWIEITLERCAGNKSKAAKQLGIDPATLWRKSKKKERN
jgi:transcriptional regulator with PAS, ATPase and Fis domain